MDDEESLRTLARRILERAGCSVFDAAAGDDALAELAAGEVDAVLTDLSMPGMSGVELASLIRMREGPSARVRIVLCTGSLDRLGTGDRAFFDAVLAKPYAPDDLVRAIGAPD